MMMALVLFSKDTALVPWLLFQVFQGSGNSFFFAPRGRALPGIASPWLLHHPLLVLLTPHSSLNHPFIQFSLVEHYQGVPYFLLGLKRIPPKVVLHPRERFSIVT